MSLFPPFNVPKQHVPNEEEASASLLVPWEARMIDFWMWPRVIKQKTRKKMLIFCMVILVFSFNLADPLLCQPVGSVINHPCAGVSLSETTVLSKSDTIGIYESGHFSLSTSEGHSNEEIDWELLKHKLKPRGKE